MRLWLALLLACAAGAADAQDRGRDSKGARHPDSGDRQAPRGDGRRHFAANPSALVAAEIELKQAAQRDGQSKAFLKFAAPGAEFFVPQRVLATELLKGQDEPKFPAEWQPLEVWMSCDGSYGVVSGAWRKTGLAGRFMTLWQRQEDRTYKWLKRASNSLAPESAEPDMIAGRIAHCAKRGATAPSTPSSGDGGLSGSSDDGSMTWLAWHKPDGSWAFELRSWDGKALPAVFRFEARPGDF